MAENNYSERLNRVIPGGAHTYSRGDDQFPLNAPQILEKGKGAYVWDAHSKKYLDYGMALRAVNLGYAHDEVDAAAIKQIHLGNNLTRASLIELEAAEKIVDLIPSVEMVKFAKNGSSVTSAAIKLARAYTGKKMIARCLQHPFFSYDDWFIGDTTLKRGIPEETSALTVNFNYNDIASLNALFEKYPNQIAGVILEPATHEEPKDNFLQKVRETCTKNSAVMILDEMITGFRWHLKGAQTYYDVSPDLSTFGKAMANGFSVAALGGKKEIMDLGGIKKIGQERVFLMSSTHGAEMCSLGAFVKTMEICQRDSVVDKLWDYGSKLINQGNNVSKELGLLDHFKFEGVGCSPVYVTKDKSGAVSLELRTLFSQEMLERGVMMPWIALSASHGERELETTMEALRSALQVYSRALEGDVRAYLKGSAIKPVFRKYN
ncbi:glutamate-1-semialdehyde 2,1-aminomutase [Bdellovibrio sp. HCB-110]|uniref:glutamate-1-semialdehyde 2,1-aminomutase n=1 Tax=Bdellovibrio sp. HCB-110 TaxID=3391182 RepID=UPI0039B6828D